MDKERESLLEKVLDELICTARSLKPEHRHWGENNKDFNHHKFGRGHMALFFRLTKQKEGVAVKDLADSFHITSGAVTQIVDSAVEMGVVTREADPNDRRSQIIKLSQKAKSKIDSFKKNYFEHLSPKFSTLSDLELQQLATLLKKINYDSKEKNV